MKLSLPPLEGKRVLGVASTGGHLEQLVKWSRRIGFGRGSTFVTFAGSQADSLIKPENQIVVDYVAPRDVRGAINTFGSLCRDVDGASYDAVLSTGAAVSVAAYAWAIRNKLPFYYIESVSRFSGPSLSGRILYRLPKANLYTQHAGYPGGRWRQTESLLSEYSTVEACRQGGRLRVFATLGTIRPYRFARLTECVSAAIGSEDVVTWQLGVTESAGLAGECFDYLDATAFRQCVLESDVVVTHGGVGTLLGLLDLGVLPVVVARLSSYGEHVDDHQLQVVGELANRGLVIDATHGLTRPMLERAAAMRVVSGVKER